MKLGPLATTVGTATLVGGSATAVMIATDKETARTSLMATNTLALPALGVAGIVGWTGAYQGPDVNGNAFERWAANPSRISTFNRAQSTAAIAAGALVGVGMANLAANVVLDINEDSLAG